MRIISCYKVCPDETTISVNQDRSLSFEDAMYNVGDFDLNAIEAGLQIAETNQAELFALSVGGQSLSDTKMRKRVLSLGPEKNFIVVDDSLDNADSLTTAKTLAEAVKKIGDVDLIICGEGSSDLYAQEVGTMLGTALELPTINAVKKIEYSDGKLKLERALGEETEMLEITLPAVISVTSDCNTPRLPGMKAVMNAGKKPTELWGAADVQIAEKKLQLASVVAHDSSNRMKCIVNGDGDEEISQFFENIRSIIA